MEAVKELFGTLTTMQWRDVLDILLVTYLIYRVVLLVRSTSAVRIAKGFMAILVISAVTQILELWTLNFLLGQILSIGLLALVILFQPELRRMMDHLGSSVSLRRFLTPEKKLDEMDMVISQTVKATVVLAKGYEGTDALKKELQDHVKRTTAPYKYPRVVEFVDELPKTISGKIRRVALREQDSKK